MFTEADIDEIISSVNKELDAAEMLAKSDKSKAPKELKKDEPQKPEDEQDPAAQAAAEPPMDAPASPGESQEPAAAAPAPDSQPPSEASPEAPAEAPQNPDQQLQGEQQPEGEISDEELMDIYQSMPPEELERHVMIAQQILSQMKGEQQAPEAPQPGEQPQPQQQQPMALSEKDNTNKLAKSDDKDKELSDLRKQVAELSKSTQLITQAMETAFKPIRKSVTGTEFVSRGSEEKPEAKPLSKSELVAELSKKARNGNTSHADREAINNYILNGVGREVVEKMVTGGK